MTKKIFLVRRPIFFVRSFTSVVLRSPATTTSVRDSATCTHTMPWRNLPFSIRNDPLAARRSAGSGAARLAIHAGAIPESTAHRTAKPIVTESTTKSGRVESSVGNRLYLAVISRKRTRHAAHANPRPSKAPGITRRKLSTSIWRNRRERAAPRATRRANSCCREEARAKFSPARFAQQMSNTAPTSICMRNKGCLYCTRR